MLTMMKIFWFIIKLPFRILALLIVAPFTRLDSTEKCGDYYFCRGDSNLRSRNDSGDYRDSKGQFVIFWFGIFLWSKRCIACDTNKMSMF